jgi:hypothetical protein
MRPQGLTTAKTVAKISVVSDTTGEEERGTLIHKNKFMGLATTVMPQEQASKIAATVRNLEETKELQDLTGLLVSRSG